MQPSSSLVVQALLAALVVTEVAAAPITQREVGYNESPIVEKRKNPLYETGVGGKPAPKPSIVNVGKIKPVAPISTTPKKPITPVTKGKREVGHNELPIVEKRKNPMYETGVGGKPAPKPSIVNVGKIKPVAPISTTPKKPITPVKGKGKREVGHDESPIVEKRKNPMYETGVGGKPAPKPSIVNVGKIKPVAPISTTPKKPITPVKGKGKREEHA
ncbi:hypothetical protein GGTG_02504 [Gaeumannomyces tritici R3-111a-1]|uniref:Uncharacterized protein n=1 Tax=Gaeumannomyces tritici (strain R3-111a-1) TaxID=644352 RepID=J3NMJ8_GAET3|nr:hypothetical protein GGTG_02504 [Gaeumannomyces tritici R3-111a-1]EJT82531.1 hypothetical protein GGTG_02504 [Gaeumannomyces tritici R3-111a-1]